MFCLCTASDLTVLPMFCLFTASDLIVLPCSVCSQPQIWPYFPCSVCSQPQIWSHSSCSVCSQRGTQFGELMFSLSYLPTAERLTVVIVKARNLKFSQNRESGDSFVKVSAVECSGLVCYDYHSLQIKRVISTRVTDSARNGNFEMPVYFLKSKQGYTVRKMQKKIYIIYIMISWLRGLRRTSAAACCWNFGFESRWGHGCSSLSSTYGSTAQFGPWPPSWFFVTITFLQGWIVSSAPNPQPGGQGLRIYDPRRQGGPAIPPGTGYPF
jgi:hypothetical protein